jgi:beta-lactamase regulating signal transducer with metallopeptidase domain
MSLLLVTFVKGTFICFIVYCITRIVKHLPSELKHLLWLCAILSFMLIPFLSYMMPGIPVATIKITDEHSEAYKTVTSLISAQENGAGAAGEIATYAPIAFRTNNLTVHSIMRWHICVLMLWLTGVGFSSFRIIRGKIGVCRLTKNRKLIQDSNSTLMLKSVSEDMGINREIDIGRSPRCTIPFMYNFFKPTIVFPVDSERWSTAKTRAVLLHELAHIKRKDNLTRFIARMICALFWYVPFLWIAYSSLYLEQEESCDAFVIHKGIQPTEYARFIVHLARYRRDHALLSGIFISKGRVKMLEKRIIHVLYPKGGNQISRGGKKMVTRILMIGMVLLLSVAVFPTSYAKDREFFMPSDNEEIYGTWVNTEYSGELSWPQKYVHYTWGYCEYYNEMESKNPIIGWDFTSTLVDKWTDAQGNIWYKEFQRYNMGDRWHQLVKISNNGTTLEFIWNKRDFPVAADLTPNSATYRIYYRQ